MSAHIPLRDKLKRLVAHAIIDECDYEEVSKHRWFLHLTGYVCTNIKREVPTANSRYRTVRLHRFIIKPPDTQDLDHKNRDKLDNRRSNLRYANDSTNCMNRGMLRNNTSGAKGVSLLKTVSGRPRKDGKKYQAIITLNRKNMLLGRFKTLEEAGEAYRKAALEIHGEFACLST